MRIGLNNKGERVEITEASASEVYYCPCCGGELVQKRGSINEHHFAHKNNYDCDEWYEMCEWHKDWQSKFTKESREVVICEDGIKHRADIKSKNSNLIVEFQNSPISGEEFEERNRFYSKNHRLVWVFNVQDKHIERCLYQHGKTIHYEWKWAYKFNGLDYFGENFALFLQVGYNTLVKVVWNKCGFKYFGGYEYTEKQFLNYLKRMNNRR